MTHRSLLPRFLITLIALLCMTGIVVWLLLQQGHNPLGPSSSETTNADDVFSPYDALMQEETKKTNEAMHTYNTAIKILNAEMCSTLEDEKIQNDCRDRIFMLTAKENTDGSMCEEIGNEDMKSSCLDAVADVIARNVGKKQLCDRINEDRLKTRCKQDIDSVVLQSILSEKTATKDICNTLESGFKEDCLRSIDHSLDETTYLQALRTLDIQLCNKIGESSLKNTCQDTVLLERSQKEGQPNLCQTISDLEKRAFCLERSMTQNDIAVFQEATKKTDLNACAPIRDTNLKNRCHDVITLALVQSTKNVALCDTLKQTGNIAPCKRIQNQ